MRIILSKQPCISLLLYVNFRGKTKYVPAWPPAFLQNLILGGRNMEKQGQHTLPDIQHTSVFNAPINKVWNAVATSEGLAAWFMPNDFQPVSGHEFHLNAGHFGMSPCQVTEVDPPHRLSFNWGKDWNITFELKDLDGQTEVTLIHSGWDADQVTEFGEPHTIVRKRMDQGWARLCQKLGSYVEG
jgi:uncharacterized protein YndB with AHSA1/START domain